MGLRTSMEALITRERGLIFDTGGSPVLSDQQIQDALDLHRIAVRYAALRPEPSFTTGGVVYLDYYSDPPAVGWEDDYLLQDLAYTDITSTPDVKEPIVGHWHFTTQPNGIGIRITGKVYDVYAAAADLLENWGASVMLNSSFTADGQTFQTAQQLDMILKVAARYRMLAAPRSLRIVQSDASVDMDGGGIVYPNYGYQG